MKIIQWFPGHMTKALRMMEENLRLVDGVIVILDARCPFACVNPRLEQLFAGRPVLYVLNKADLVEQRDIARNLSALKAEGKQAVAAVGTEKRSVRAVYDGIFAMLAEKTARNRAKGVFKPMRVMVAGIPNTGKSTVINSLSGAKKAVTGDKAGVTKGKQWIRLFDLELLDTPGTMPPSFENQELVKHLAYIGSVNDDILDFTELAPELLEELWQRYPALLAEKYGIGEEEDTPLKKYEKVCRRRGFLLRGGEYDYERCAKAVVDDFRKGRIGKICLE